MTEVNFLWGGNRFNFLQNLVIKSHIKVGHTPVIWISGTKPKGDYWKEIENKIVEKNADLVYNIEKFLSEGGNYRTAADLWRWHFLYEKGGIWCDSDLFALKHIPRDEWIVCSGEGRPLRASAHPVRCGRRVVSRSRRSRPTTGCSGFERRTRTLAQGLLPFHPNTMIRGRRTVRGIEA